MKNIEVSWEGHWESRLKRLISLVARSMSVTSIFSLHTLANCNDSSVSCGSVVGLLS